ncbi:unnamed protein product [Acanthosepion pharaonis]|uniref:C-type lectin domain-containing protein n=1 Tax=Acanthosepion pharaonis TaxID=158019 RepID=A0A812B587_ACAPH|nr:unnamed protein product [Sepia pharaonis]
MSFVSIEPTGYAHSSTPDAHNRCLWRSLLLRRLASSFSLLLSLKSVMPSRIDLLQVVRSLAAFSHKDELIHSAVLAEPIGYEVNAELGKLIENVSSIAWIGYNYIPDHANESNIDIGYWSDWSPESITVALWDINQPSLNFGRCTYISQTTNNDWKWRLSPCEDIKPFLCQRTACLQGKESF